MTEWVRTSIRMGMITMPQGSRWMCGTGLSVTCPPRKAVSSHEQQQRGCKDRRVIRKIACMHDLAHQRDRRTDGECARQLAAEQRGFPPLHHRIVICAARHLNQRG